MAEQVNGLTAGRLPQAAWPELFARGEGNPFFTEQLVAEGVHFERAWLDPESGMVFCLSTGPSKEAVRRVHEKAGHPADEIYELPVEV